MIEPVKIFALFCLVFNFHKAVGFWRNIQRAKSTGLPYTFSLLHELEIWAYITDPLLRWRYSAYLMEDQGWPSWARFMVKDWMYEDKRRAHQLYGDVFLVVAPGGIVCYIADAKSAMAICSRRKDFIKPPEKMKMLEPFGPNVVSSEGDLWRFHVRITLPPFGDTVNRLVWSETFRQTSLLCLAWAAKGSRDLKVDIYSLTVNVMSCVGFGQQAEWTSENAPPIGHSMSLVDAVYGVVAYLPHILLLPKWVLVRSPWKKAYQSYVEYGNYMGEFLSVEKAKIAKDSSYEGRMKGNLLTAILKSNQSNHSEKSGSRASYRGRTALTDEEVSGNTFIFLLAGYDTTANTIIFSTITLALYDRVQNRLIEEVDRIYNEAEKEGRDELTFTDDLPKFRYLLAFMYEIMRVFPIVIPIGRLTTTPQDLLISSGPKPTTTTHTLPANCGIIVNNTAIHYSPAYWPHPHIIEPLRWLSPSPNTYDPTTVENPNNDTINSTTPILNHTKGTFMTFSEGPRACLGRRFAQVEFVAFFAGLMRRYRVKLGEGAERGRVERMIRLRSGGSPVTLVPPEDVKLNLEVR